MNPMKLDVVAGQGCKAGENVRVDPRGQRNCMECRRASERRRYYRLKGAA